MSLPQNGRAMELPEAAGGSVHRARERMGAGMVRDDQQGTGRPQPRALQGRTGPVGAAISRPTQIPQWPLPNFPTPEPYPGPESNLQTAQRQRPPQRPPRPSHVPSILDGSRIQDPTPVFQYQARDGRDSDQESISSVTPASSSTQTDSTASVPDFPMPTATGPPAMPPPRRSVTLGPPPSSRRGASSFYSNISYVSPIPEESPRVRSYTSLASSAAMPESWGSISAGNSPGYSDVHYGDSIRSSSNESGQEDGRRNKIVRSASIGKREKPHIVMHKATPSAGASEPTYLATAQENPFADGTGLANASSSDSLKVPSNSSTPPSAEASSSESVQSRRVMAPPPAMGYNRLSAIRRPPRLDMEAVEKAQARGSMTSLPDLIRRATRLAAIIDRGDKRPGSRFDELDYPDEKMGGAYSDRFSGMDDPRQSGLSDMLAAFPPPAQAASRASRVGSWFTSWPLPPNHQDNIQQNGGVRTRGGPEGNRGRRKYCGLPLWGLILVILLVVGIIAAAVFVPLHFFVFNKNDPSDDSPLGQCQNQLSCENGGTNVVTRDVCSCICTNGFTGADCTTEGASGCTTTRLVNLDENPNVDNVTLGQAIPRLISEAEGNFSIPLSGTTILARFNMGSLSCTAQNSLVTFDGESGSVNAAQAASQKEDLGAEAAVQGAVFVSVSVITVFPAPTSSGSTGGFRTIPRQDLHMVNPGTTTTTVTETVPSSSAPPSSAPPAPTNGINAPTANFTVTDEVLDFARVAVLFILQENGVSEASRAQSVLQRFFTESDEDSQSMAEKAFNLDLGNDNAIDLINLRVDAGSGVKGPSIKRAVGNAVLSPRGCGQFDRRS